MLGADFSTTFGDITHSQAMLFLRLLLAVAKQIQRVHIEFGDPNEEAWSGKGFLIFFVIADNMTSVLAQETLNTLSELLAADC